MTSRDSSNERGCPWCVERASSSSVVASSTNARELEVQIAEMYPHHRSALIRLNREADRFTLNSPLGEAVELLRRWQSGILEGLLVRAKLKSVDLGVVGAMLFATGAKALRVEAFLLGKLAGSHGVELQMLTLLGAIAQFRGLPAVEVSYYGNGRNRLARDFFDHVGAHYCQETVTGVRYDLPANYVASLGAEFPCKLLAKSWSAPASTSRCT